MAYIGSTPGGKVAFGDEVRRVLEHPLDGPVVRPDLLAHWRALLFRVLDEDALRIFQFDWTHARWTAPGALEAWAGAVWAELTSGLGAVRDEARLLVLADALLTCAVAGTALASFPPLERAELRRILEATRDRVPQGDIGARAYLVELGALDVRTGARTPIGEVLWGLTGRDSIRWMLAVESARATPDDDNRLHPRYMAAFVENPRVRINWEFERPGPSEYGGLTQLGRFTWSRLARMGLVEEYESEGEPEVGGWTVTEFGKELFAELLADPPSLIVLLARAAARDTLAAAISNGPPPQTGVEASRELSRLVAHEMRNKLVPLRASVDSADVDRARRLIDEIDQFVGRVAEFASPARSIEDIDLRRAVLDAVDAVRVEVNGRLRPELVLREAAVRGSADRLQLAFVQLLRNAAQARRGTEPVTLRVEITVGEGATTVAFDDDGRGILPEHLPEIWTRGWSATGGTGLGLSLVKQIVEVELAGRATVGESTRNGARFEISLPTRKS